MNGTPTPVATSVVSQDSLGRAASAQEQAELISAIQAYFELCYQTLSVSQPYDFQLTGFGDLISDSAAAQIFLEEELAKLAVDLKNAQVIQLRNVNYKYSLDFQAMTLDASGQTAAVSQAESRQVVMAVHTHRQPQRGPCSQMSPPGHLQRPGSSNWRTKASPAAAAAGTSVPIQL